MFVPIFIIPGLHGRDASYSQNGELPTNSYLRRAICTTYTDTGDTKYIALNNDRPGKIAVAIQKEDGSSSFIGFLTLSPD